MILMALFCKDSTFGTEQQLDRGAKLHIHILVQVWLPSDKNTIVHLKITQLFQVIQPWSNFRTNGVYMRFPTQIVQQSNTKYTIVWK